MKMKRAVIAIVDSNTFAALTIASFIGMLFVAVPILNDKEGRPVADPAYVAQVQASVPEDEKISVVVYGDSRGAFFGEGAALVPGWSPVVNEAREGCAFLGQDEIWRQYGPTATPSQRTTSEQGDGTVVECDTRTYITGYQPHYDLAIVYAGTLFTVNNGTTSDVASPVEGFMDPAGGGQWEYLLDNFTETLDRINADTVVILSTPISTAYWAGLTDPYWAEPDRIMAVNSMLAVAATNTGAIYLEGFAQWVEAQDESCQPDGSHFAVWCAVAAGEWVSAQLP